MDNPPFTLHRGNSLDVLKTIADASVDSIVTDPPYELTSKRPSGRAAATEGAVMKGFMGMAWDGSGIANNVELWREALRVLKPGGHMLAFSGTRTYHRMVCAIEDAGFEIRDRIRFECSTQTKYGALLDSMSDEQRGMLLELLNEQIGLGSELAWEYGSGFPKSKNLDGEWQGWGSALKPAHEPIVVARKPMAKGCTVAANVLAHGTGALNIDGCRVEHMTVADGNLALNPHLRSHINGGNGGNIIAHEKERRVVTPNALGRWPANVIHDGSDEVLSSFPDSGGSGPARTLKRGQRAVGEGFGMADAPGELRDAGTGSAARFFYCAKASRSDRNDGLDGVVDVTIEWSSVIENGEWDQEARRARLLMDTGLSPTRVIGAFGAVNSDATAWSTMLFGSSTTGQFLLGTTCTTGTKTSCTTPLEILSFFQSWITNESTQVANCEMMFGGSPVENAGTGTLQTVITNARMALALGVERAALPMRLRINASAAKSFHPTVKPTDLCRYLLRLVTPPGGITLDCFMGSGSFGKAAMLEGFRFIGIDLDSDADGNPLGYIDIARARILHAWNLAQAERRAAEETAKNEAEEKRQHDLFADLLVMPPSTNATT